MRKITVMAAVVAMSFAGPLWACDKEGKIVKAGGKIPPCCQAKLKGAVAKVIKNIPSMAYRVGDFETRCFKSATAKAGENGKVQFVAAGKPYDNETEATVALAALLEKEVDNLKNVHFAVGDKTYYCSVSAQAACKNGQKMKYRLAGFDFNTQEQADKALRAINCKLAGCTKDCINDCLKNCPKAAAALAAGAKVGCNKGKAAQVASTKDWPCHKGKSAGATLAGAKKGCCAKGKGKAKVAAGEGPPCKKGKAATLAAGKKIGCCKKAQQRLASVQDQIRLIVETAANMALSS